MTRLAVILAVSMLSAAVLAGCTADTAPPCTPRASSPGAESVCFLTADGWVIQGVVYNPNATDAASALLLHGFREQHGQYDALASRLDQAGMRVLSVDLRGHGESIRYTQGPSPSLDRFAQRHVVAMQHDLNASQAYMEETPDVIVGASVAANLALVHANRSSAVDVLVLLSPIPGQGGLEPLAPNRGYEGAIAYIAAEEDTGSANMARALSSDHTGGPARLEVYPGTAHGTQHLDNATRLAEIEGWILDHTTAS